MAEDFYNFKLDFLRYLKKSTGSAREFLNPEFIEQLELGTSPLTPLLEEAESYRRLSRTPLGLLGGEDEAVPDSNT
jgi:hypothetical protein